MPDEFAGPAVDVHPQTARDHEGDLLMHMRMLGRDRSQGQFAERAPPHKPPQAMTFGCGQDARRDATPKTPRRVLPPPQSKRFPDGLNLAEPGFELRRGIRRASPKVDGQLERSARARGRGHPGGTDAARST